MSFIDLRPYFEARMNAVDPELNQWEDAFNIENIPANVLDKAWHINFGPMSYTGTAQMCLQFEAPVTLQVFLKGYREPKNAVDIALKLADAIIKECSNPLNRLTQPKIKNVLPNLVDIRKLAESNDNSVILEISFDCIVIICS